MSIQLAHSFPDNYSPADYLSGLNPAQHEAVVHGKGPLLVFAGAGSGKTRVLTVRIAHLILEHQVDPSEIFAVTFTNKAATEMKSRVAKLLQQSTAALWVSTFHSSCARILRSHAKHLDFTSSFVIYDTSDAMSALKRVFAKQNVDPKYLDPRRVMARIDKAKNNFECPDDLRKENHFALETAHTIANLYEGYQKELLASNAMDFGDLLCNTLTLFKLEKQICEGYQDQFQHLLVDEYQDTNKVQYQLVKLLAEKNKNICVVGDDDQSIYAFRGATVENILNFKRDFPDAKTVTLETNYRSSANILSAANKVIAKNQRRQHKEMKAVNPAGNKIVRYQGSDEKDEANFVIQEIVTLQKKGVSLKEIAIFYRTNAQSRAVEEKLCEEGLAYEIYGGFKFYERKEVKDVLAYYRLLINPQDTEAFLRVINIPARGIGPTTLATLNIYAESKKEPLFQALKLAIAHQDLKVSAGVLKKLASFVDLIGELTELAKLTQEQLLADNEVVNIYDKGDLIALLLQKIVERSGYLSALKAEDTTEAESRIENIFELLNVAAEFTKRLLAQNQQVLLSDFLERTSLSSDLDRGEIVPTGSQGKGDKAVKDKKRMGESVSLMSLHLAKGLEFDHVFFIGLEEGLLPHIRSLESKQDIEEERRLCYVGITRARKQLTLSHVSNRQSFGRGNFFSGIPSRFLRDIPNELFQYRGSEHNY
jgi:DNA helicase-2/ATP-dependent DNA helicase PcrA